MHGCACEYQGRWSAISDVLKLMFVCDGSVMEFSHDASQLPVDVGLDQNLDILLLIAGGHTDDAEIRE